MSRVAERATLVHGYTMADVRDQRLQRVVLATERGLDQVEDVRGVEVVEGPEVGR
jgi:hypothetical protein